MGRTLKVLAERELPERPTPASRILVDLCENVHIHSRELRQEFSVAEFREHVATLTQAGIDLTTYLARNPDYEEGAYPDLVTLLGVTPKLIEASPRPNESAYYPRRLRIELIAPHSMGGVHLHWRDYRLNISRTELRLLAEAATEAVLALCHHERTKGYRDKPQPTMDAVRRQCAKPRPLPGRGHFGRLVQGKRK